MHFVCFVHRKCASEGWNVIRSPQQSFQVPPLLKIRLPVSNSTTVRVSANISISRITTCPGSDTVAKTRPALDGLDINPYSTVKVAIVAVIAGFVSLITVGGNLVVLLSFFLERTIRQSSNYFIASLAVSDLLIGSVSMPFYTLYLLTGQNWPLGQMICDLWLSIDYTVCMTSIYTVFCITVDRFCSVKLPAKYRKWRTDGKVFIIIGVTWFVPAVVFFTSIIGWQYFVGKRTVPEDKCYVQYMESAVFNVVLQIGYFWTTLVLMCVLYTGIYQVALGLQRKSNQKQKKTSTLVSMAGQTVTTTIGIGISVRPQKVADKPNKEVVDGVATSASSPGAAAGISRRPMLSKM